MQNKDALRKKYLNIRKKNYFEIRPSFFKPLIKLIKKKFKNKHINLSSFYPSLFEVNVLNFFELKNIGNINICLPIIKKNKKMYFHKWKKHDPLRINTFGMLEPFELSKNIVPDIMLVPLLAFDSLNYRLGYGGGFYDRYLNKYLRLNKNIMTIGIAFSFQKYHKIPASNNDVQLDYVLTEKGITK